MHILGLIPLEMKKSVKNMKHRKISRVHFILVNHYRDHKLLSTFQLALKTLKESQDSKVVESALLLIKNIMLFDFIGTSSVDESMDEQ